MHLIKIIGSYDLGITIGMNLSNTSLDESDSNVRVCACQPET